MKPKPWFSRFGPLSWYKNPETGKLEWFEIQLFWRHMMPLHLIIWCWRGWHLTLLARVERVSRYGFPSCWTSKFSWSGAIATDPTFLKLKVVDRPPTGGISNGESS